MRWHNPKDDAVNQSNSKEKWVNQITVELSEREKRLIGTELALMIQRCLFERRKFILHNKIESLLFDPMLLTGVDKQTGILLKYDNQIDFLNGVKLSLISYKEIYILPIEIANQPEQNKLC